MGPEGLAGCNPDLRDGWGNHCPGNFRYFLAGYFPDWVGNSFHLPGLSVDFDSGSPGPFGTGRNPLIDNPPGRVCIGLAGSALGYWAGYWVFPDHSFWCLAEPDLEGMRFV